MKNYAKVGGRKGKTAYRQPARTRSVRERAQAGTPSVFRYHKAQDALRVPKKRKGK